MPIINTIVPSMWPAEIGRSLQHWSKNELWRLEIALRGEEKRRKEGNEKSRLHDAMARNAKHDRAFDYAAAMLGAPVRQAVRKRRQAENRRMRRESAQYWERMREPRDIYDSQAAASDFWYGK